MQSDKGTRPFGDTSVKPLERAIEIAEGDANVGDARCSHVVALGGR